MGNFAWAQGTQSDDADSSASDTKDLGKVVVTGSRIKRSELEGPQPILVIDQEQMTERGYTTVYEALSDLSINNGYKFEGAEAALFTPDVETINLRGFGVGTTLTLINGRRLTNYPAAYQSNATVFSFGSIPVAAIERIEILATGASAIYGSDAVAGVVNIILKSDIDETTVNALWGTPTGTKTTRDDIRLQLTTGKTFDRGSYTFTAEYLNRDSIRGMDYDRYDNTEQDYPYGQGYHVRTILTLDWWKYYFTNGDYYRDPTEIFGTSGDQACSQAGTGLVYGTRPGSGKFCGDPGQGAAEINFQNARESYSLYFNGKYEIGDNGTELFTDILYYSGKSKSYSNTIYLSEDIFDLSKPSSIAPIPGDYGYLDYDWYSAQRAFNSADLGMDLSEKFEDEAYTVVAGARGVWADRHDWEASVNYSHYKYTSHRPWFKWRETIDTFLGTWLGTGYAGSDWWTGGTLGEGLEFGFGDPNNLYGVPNDAARNTIGTQTYGNKTDDLFLQFVLDGDLMEMNAGPLQYSFVAEYEDETLKFTPDALIQQSPPSTDVNGDPINGLTGSGWYRLTGYNGDGDRQRWSLGGELRVPLLSTLTLNLAARYDSYDSTSTSFGGDLTPSGSIEWRPFTSLLVRAGYTQSFRAPDMAQVFVRTGFFTSGYDYVACYEQYVFVNGTDEGFSTANCNSNSLFAQRIGAQDLGGEALDAETGDSWWAGFSWDVTDNLSVTVDYTHMKLEQRVLQQSVQGLLNDEWSCFIGDQPDTTSCDQVPNQIIRQTDPNSGISFIEDFYVTPINQFEEQASFVDVKVVYNLPTEYGNFRFEGDYNNVVDHTQKLTPDSEEVDLRNDPVNGGWDFRASFIGSLTYTYRDFTTTLTSIYRGGTALWTCTTFTNGCVGNVTGEDYLETGNYWTDSYITWNWTAAYNWTNDLSTRVRVVNVFDESPPWDDTFQGYEYPWYNYFVYPGAGIGRYAAVELQYTF
ncbi:MAG: TonB-dependent receptor [Lysobacterales bacterium]|jgi:outer membrane receptor protein involved in Fe transport